MVIGSIGFRCAAEFEHQFALQRHELELVIMALGDSDPTFDKRNRI
ncbi:hypothetical protein CLV75_3970 [Ruegeria conchae]|uniref:Uncharacterized protein n=1 Tax=Ruegeria conchae TaxID=981384 RepID=A0A497YSC4_9RHOB|nr:hypothetical protein CLV75_3970 [Ruegeria conchae]